MTVFNFCGLVDKKFLVLPLANAMSVLGDTLIVTDDNSYRYYITEENKVGAVRVLIMSPEEITTKSHVDYDDGIDYQNVIYDTVDKIDKEADRIIIVRNKDRRLIPPLVLEVSDVVDEGVAETETKEVVLTSFYNKLELRKNHYCDRGEDMNDKAVLIELKPVHFKWLQLISETKEIEKLNDKMTLSTLAGLVSDVLKLHGKDIESLMLSDK